MAQLLRRYPQSLIREWASAAGSVSPSPTACRMRRALVPSKSDTTLVILMWLFPSSASSPVVELHAATRDLVVAAHHGPPEPLLGVRHKTEMRDRALHQTLRIGTVSLSPFGAPIPLRLCKVQCAGDRVRIGRVRASVSSAAPAPHKPVANNARSTRHHFLDVALDEPLRKRAQLDGAGPDLQPLA